MASGPRCVPWGRFAVHGLERGGNPVAGACGERRRCRQAQQSGCPCAERGRDHGCDGRRGEPCRERQAAGAGRDAERAQMYTRKVLQTSVRSVRSVRNPRVACENACLHAENRSDAPSGRVRQKWLGERQPRQKGAGAWLWRWSGAHRAARACSVGLSVGRTRGRDGGYPARACSRGPTPERTPDRGGDVHPAQVCSRGLGSAWARGRGGRPARVYVRRLKPPGWC